MVEGEDASMVEAKAHALARAVRKAAREDVARGNA
jgi:hypothetical protein